MNRAFQFCYQLRRTNKEPKKIADYGLRDIAKPVELAYQEVYGLYTNAPCNVLATYAVFAGCSWKKMQSAPRKVLKL